MEAIDFSRPFMSSYLTVLLKVITYFIMKLIIFKPVLIQIYYKIRFRCCLFVKISIFEQLSNKIMLYRSIS